MRHCTALLRATAASALVVAAVASAQTFTEFPIGTGTIGGITTGPDGNVWFTETTANSIGRITTTGIVTVFPISSAGAHPQQITAGADHNLWFTESRAIGRITIDGVISEFPISFGASPVSIASGPDGNIWFTLSISHVGRITPDGTFTDFETGYLLNSITAGPDGNIWVTSIAEEGGKICRITPDGAITQFYEGLTPLEIPQQIIAGPDGNLWFTQSSLHLGRIMTDGTITQYTIGISPSSITVWNGALWLTDGSKLLRVTTDGLVRDEVALPATAGIVTAMTSGPDGKLWFVEASGTIGRVAFQRRRAARH